jgi:hypothetical protein
MTAARDPYVKVYYRIADDERFGRVYNNDAALATWLRLLILADGMWPAAAPIPRGVKAVAFNLLVDVGLIDLANNGHAYRIHGMDAERGKRSEHASRASRGRWESNPPSNPRGNAPSNAQTMPLNSDHLNSNQRSATHAPAGAAKNGSKTPETDAERLARYRSYIGDKSKSADIREAAAKEVELIESRMAVH